MEDFSEAIRLRPDDPDAFVNRANVRYRNEDLEGALQDYTEAIRLRPSDAAAFGNRGNLRRRRAIQTERCRITARPNGCS